MKTRRLLSFFVRLVVVCPIWAKGATGPAPVGRVQSVERQLNGVTLMCADGAKVRLLVLAADLVRVRTIFAGQAEGKPDHSWAIERTDWAAVPWQFNEESGHFTLLTDELEVVVQRDSLLVEFRDPVTHALINADQHPMTRDPATEEISIGKRLGLDEHFYGLGEKAARLDRRRSAFQMWNSDTPAYREGTDPIYQSIPFYIGWEKGNAYGLFYDNSYRTFFDFGRTSQEAVEYKAEGGEANYYFFKGPDIKKILARYADLTGHMPLPPRWALGHQQSRYSYFPATMVQEIAHHYREHDLPLDVMYLDIHYMNGYRVFTWDPVRYPDPAGLTKELGKQGIKVVTIIDPGVKFQEPAAGASDANARAGLGPQDASYYVYNQGLAKDYFLHRKEGSLYIGAVWPGKAVFVDYTREDARRWWGDLHSALLDQGIAGVWTDMNEPSDFVDKSGATQTDVIFDDLSARTSYAKNRNTFALNMARATYQGLERLRPEQRPFVITRAGYAGVQRYSTVWTGDNNASFDALALNIPMFASLGLSGEPFVGADLPGFVGRADGELLARSYEMAFLAPLCRNHGEFEGYDHEPWRFGAAYENIVRKYLKLRYQLLPFLYTTLEEAHRTGVPLFRPLLLNFQQDRNALNIDDEYMIGDALLSAPVVHALERGREVYLPRGHWYDYWTSAPLEGGDDLRRVEVPLDQVPLYIRGGSIIPSTRSMNYVSEKSWDPLRFDVYPDDEGSAAGTLYEDDGTSPAYKKGNFRRTRLSYHQIKTGTHLELEAPVGTYQPGARFLEFNLHATPKAAGVTVDGKELSEVKAGASGAAWWRVSNELLSIRLQDDSRAHSIQVR